jgi:hypothetical protein
MSAEEFKKKNNIGSEGNVQSTNGSTGETSDAVMEDDSNGVKAEEKKDEEKKDGSECAAMK